MKIKYLIIELLLVLSFYSCEKDENQADMNIVGTWKGSFSSSLIDNMGIMLIIMQDGNEITGNYYSDMSVGTISGSVDGNKLAFTLTQTSSYCTGTFSGSGSISDASISFNFQGTDCMGAHSNGIGEVTKESSSTDLPNFSQVDLIGIWIGTATNSQNSFSVTLTVTSTGIVSGSGVSSAWTIDSKGTVTGGGSFSFISGSYFYVASASWYLQINDGKETLTGIFDVYISGLHDLEICLVKQ